MPFAETKRLTTDGAKKMMAAAISRADGFGIAATVAIADAGGHLLLLERMDGGRFHTVHSATVKAVCAANAIVRGQQETGALATWGFDTRFGRPLCSFNWPCDNMCG
ncbi:MAG: heme-binding protein, partial [Nitrospinota bacterium]|nr:heme-binding protein [Nitrospinota bacterium]